MEDGILIDSNNHVFMSDARYDYEFAIDKFERATLAIEKLREAMKVVDVARLKDMQNSLLDLKLTYDEYKRYMYSTASNNQLKRHGLPMRRKVKK